MSRSTLVSHVNISPNKTKGRPKPIDSVVIHCMAYNGTIERCGKGFANPDKRASSNYGIGSDGRIGLYVEEEDRSWCTSSSAVDSTAITIEVANDAGAPDWHVSDKALEALIQLLVDICQRNEIPKLLWLGNKNLIGKTDQQNMVVHRWIKNKACPGDYLYKLHPSIAAEVNKRLGAATAVLPVIPQTPSSSGSNDEIIWNYLAAKGLNDFAIAGIMGNIYAESGLNPVNMQNSYEKKLGFNDLTYTAAVDTGSYKNFTSDKAGYGLCQWTSSGRKQGLLDMAKSMKLSIGSITVQLSFLWKELEASASTILNPIRAAKSIKEASDVFLKKFERPADQSETNCKKRATNGQKYYDKFAKGNTASVIPVPPTVVVKPDGPVNYVVKVTANELNFRAGPGTNYKVNGCIKDKGKYTIIEEANGQGAKRWGKLKSGAGWISLDFTVKA